VPSTWRSWKLMCALSLASGSDLWGASSPSRWTPCAVGKNALEAIINKVIILIFGHDNIYISMLELYYVKKFILIWFMNNTISLVCLY
jgi:hypothetical protein